MSITDKQLLVLKSIVDFYISAGEPVGSKAVCADLGYSVSPATVRNYMAELNRHGLIIQPHTSAGRIPSEKGYRVYVDKFVNSDNLNIEIKSYIDELLSNSGDEPGQILQKASDILHQITGGITLISSPLCEDVRVYRIRFVQISRYTAMAVLITSAGTVKTQLFRCDFIVTDEVMTIFEKVFNETFAGLPLTDITPAFLQTTAVRLGEMGMLMSNALWTIKKLSEDANKISIISSGDVMSMPESGFSYDTINNISVFLKNKERLSHFLEKSDNCVLIGSETGQDCLNDTCVIIGKYLSSENAKGTIAVICPIRTNYALSIPAVTYTAQAVENLIKDITLMDN